MYQSDAASPESQSQSINSKHPRTNSALSSAQLIDFHLLKDRGSDSINFSSQNERSTSEPARFAASGSVSGFVAKTSEIYAGLAGFGDA